MVPLIDRNGCSDEFLKKNVWAESYFDEKNDFVMRREILKEFFLFKWTRSFIRGLLKGKLGDYLEKKVKRWQIKRAKGKAEKISSDSSLIVNKHMLKFHNIDRRRQYRGLWKKHHGTEKLTNEKFREITPYS